MATPPVNGNGHRRRQVRARVLAEEDLCALCDAPVDKTLTVLAGTHGARCKGSCAGCVPHPERPEVDEDVPRSRGGSPYRRSNCRLMHRRCNGWKGTMTLDEARARLAQQSMAAPKAAAVQASSIW